MVLPGSLRAHLARTLKAAYADGLLSEETFVARLECVFAEPVIDRRRLVGDLTLRRPGLGLRTRIGDTLSATANRLLGREDEEALVLALDWSGVEREMVIGRHCDCDLVLSDPTVSRRHARLVFRDGHWVLHDLASTNGTLINGERVGRCALRPGDRVRLGDATLQVD